MNFIIDKIRRLILRQSFKSYSASDNGFDQSNFWLTFKNVRKSYNDQCLTATFDNYCTFIQGLRNLRNTKIVPLRDLFQSQPDDKRIISLRYDIDADPITALRMARYNARYGICGSFYLLHTAYYYGVMSNSVFIRNSLLKEWILGFIVSGCEIGLHIDPFSLYIDHRVNGASGIVEELKWLRRQGAKIYGTVAHNSFPAYGAENFEIFKGYTIWKRPFFEKNNIKVPLGILDQKELGLEYEGNYAEAIDLKPSKRAKEWLDTTIQYAAQSKEWMCTYLFDNPYCKWGPDVIVWPVSGHNWAVAARPVKSSAVFEWNISIEETLAVLDHLPLGTRTSVVIHPIYFSQDIENA